MDRRFKHNDSQPFQALVEKPNLDLEEIYAQYGGLLKFTIGSILVHDKHLVQEVIVETLEILWVKLEEVVRLDKPLVWMLRVAQLQAYAMRRKIKRIHYLEIEKLAYYQGDMEADRSLSYRELKAVISKASSQLTAREREIFSDAKFEELTIEELSHKYGISKQSVSNKLASAVKKIRRILREIGFTIFI